MLFCIAASFCVNFFYLKERMAAYTQYLWEDYLRNSDVGQAAILEAEQEEVEHKKLLAENDRVTTFIK